jgi:hypothetical protein
MTAKGDVEGIRHTQTRQGINSINIHRTAPTNPLPTTSPKCECRINLILNPNQRIQHHRSRLIQIQSIGLHPRLGGWLVGVPAVDVEGFDLGFGSEGGILDCGGFGGGDSAGGGMHCSTALTNGVLVVYGCHVADLQSPWSGAKRWAGSQEARGGCAEGGHCEWSDVSIGLLCVVNLSLSIKRSAS